MSMTATCLCGGIRIALDGPVGPVGYCHCTQCQKASGSAFGANADVRRQDWTWVSGDDLLTEYESSPGTFRAFCRRCGSPVYKRRAADPDTRRIWFGLLDDDPGRRALVHVWVESKASWFEITDALPQCLQGPTGAPLTVRPPMSRAQAESHALEWAQAWNRRDVDAVLAHFDDQVVFASPKALVVTGAAVVHGKAALRAYWTAAIASVQLLRFVVRRVLWDPETRELSIIYDRDVDGTTDRAAEMLAFGGQGLVVRGEVLYGVVP
jgi:hypothetical protein